MTRFFNTAGPCRAELHYMLPAAPRLPPGIRGLIDQQKYFLLRAPRQVGKSTSLRALAQELTAAGRYLAVLLSMETGAPFGEDITVAEGAILADWRGACCDQLPAALQPPPWPAHEPGAGIGDALRAWAQAAPRPLVVFLDEIDALKDASLEAILRQLRSGYSARPRVFPHALALCGMRDVRDYQYRVGLRRSHSASPFNIKDESLTMEGFSLAEVAALLGQHAAATGQPFLPEALERVHALTCGQPWLVNALARQAVETVVPDRGQPIGAAAIDQAREILIQRRDTHVDSLAERLHEERVRRIIEPILVGETLTPDILNDDLLYCRDLGLVRDRVFGA